MSKKETTVVKKTKKINKYDLLNDSDDDESIGGGIYSKKLFQTKKEFCERQTNYSIKGTEEIQRVKNVKAESSESSHDDDEDDDDVETSEEETVTQQKRDKSPIVVPPPPPPPPALKRTSRDKRDAIDDFIKNLNPIKRDDSILFDNDGLNESLVDNLITVRVSTKDGIKKWEIAKNSTFKFIFDELCKTENTNIESILLMLNERVITSNDTPMSVGLQLCDIIDYCKVTKPVQERIRIVDSDDELESNNGNHLTIMLQGEEGRKSRVKFSIAMDEKFGNVLKRYCEKRELDYSKYILEFDGEHVNLEETPTDLDIEGDEMFDVRCGNKPINQVINSKKYDFDDDILCI